jgi:hypothetical protein
MHNGPSHQGKLGYETQDITGKLVFWFLFVLAVVTVCCVIAMVFMFGLLTKELPAAATVVPSQVAPGRILPPEPRLQASPPIELKAFREKEEAVLTTYGWVDKSEQKARIPVERALELVAERGLPYHKAGEPLPVLPPAPLPAPKPAAPGAEPVASSAAQPVPPIQAPAAVRPQAR